MAAAPRGTGIVRHEFAAEGEEELTVEVGDRVDVFEEHDGWLLCRRQDTGAMGLVPATYIEEQRAAVEAPAGKKHRREPTLGGDEEASEPLVPMGPEPPKGKHRREPTFEFEEGQPGAREGVATHKTYLCVQVPRRRWQRVAGRQALSLVARPGGAARSSMVGLIWLIHWV